MAGFELVGAKYNSNALVEYILRPWLLWQNYRFWKSSKPSLHKYIFVVGAPRSGTTLLNVILKSHSQVSGFDNETRCFSYKNRFNKNAYHDHFNEAEWQRCMGSANNLVELFDVMHDKHRANTSWVVEKTPQHVKHLKFILRHFPNSKIINVMRDGRDCYCSARSAANIPQAKKLEDYAHYWVKSIRSRLSVKSDADRIVDVRYEDLVANPKAEATKVMSFIGLPFESDQLNSLKLSQDVRSNEPEFNRIARGIDSSTVARWKAELTKSEKEIFSKIAGPVLQEVGYYER